MLLHLGCSKCSNTRYMLELQLQNANNMHAGEKKMQDVVDKQQVLYI